MLPDVSRAGHRIHAPPHRHAGPVFGYVLEGEYEHALDDRLEPDVELDGRTLGDVQDLDPEIDDEHTGAPATESRKE